MLRVALKPVRCSRQQIALVRNGQREAAQFIDTSRPGRYDVVVHTAGADRMTPSTGAGRIPVAHLLFLRDLALIHHVGPYLFVHAGLRPGIPLHRQARQDMLWIREPFLSAKGPFLRDTPRNALEGAGGAAGAEPAMVVVHGHTPTQEPVVRSNRIGIDTGAVMGGVLTCAVLEGDRVGFLTN